MALDFEIGVRDLTPEGPRPQPAAGDGLASAPSGATPVKPPHLSVEDWKLILKNFGPALAQVIAQRGEIGGVPLRQALALTPAPTLSPTTATAGREPGPEEEVSRLLATPADAGLHKLEEIVLPAEVQAAPKIAAEMRQLAAVPTPSLEAPEVTAIHHRALEEEASLPFVGLESLDKCISDKLVPAVEHLADTIEDSERSRMRAEGGRPAAASHELREIREIRTMEEVRAELVPAEPAPSELAPAEAIPELIDLVLPARSVAEMTDAVAAGILRGFAEAGPLAATEAAALPEEDIAAASRQQGLPTPTYALASEPAAPVETIPLEPEAGPRTYELAPEAKPLVAETIPILYEASEAPLIEERVPEVYAFQPTERVEEERVPLAAEATPTAVLPIQEPLDELEVLDDDDPRVHARERRDAEIKAAKRQTAYDELMARDRGEELQPARVIDPNEEARKKHLESVNESLEGGARIAGAAAVASGRGHFVAEGIAGAAALAGGIGTGDPIAATLGGLALVDAGLDAFGAAMDTTAGVFDTLTGIVNHEADAWGELVANNYIGYLSAQLQGVGEVLGAIPLVGKPVEAAFGALAAPVEGFLHLTEDLLARGQELSQYSGPLAAADALAEVRAQLADMHEADVLGPDLARLTDAYSQSMTELREMFLPFRQGKASSPTPATLPTNRYGRRSITPSRRLSACRAASPSRSWPFP